VLPSSKLRALDPVELGAGGRGSWNVGEAKEVQLSVPMPADEAAGEYRDRILSE
jgi:hypothetical protein